MHHRHSLPLLLLAALLSMLAGCTYALPGKVIDGFGSVTVGQSQDLDAQKGGVQGAVVELIRDPDSMNRARVGQATSDKDGRFTLEVDSFGAGWMEEKWQLRVRRSGYENIESEVQLPGSPGGKLLIISLQRGRSAPFREPEGTRGLMDEAKKYEPGVGSTVR